MYPELKNFQKKLNKSGPLLFSNESLSLCIFFCIFLNIFLTSLDIDSKVALFASVKTFYEYAYFKSKWKLDFKKEKGKNIIENETLKENISPILFLRLKSRSYFFIIFPYSIFLSLFLKDFSSTLACDFLSILVLSYESLSSKKTIDKLSNKPIPLLFENKKIDSKKDINNSNEDIKEKDRNLKKINEFDSKKLIAKLIKRNKF